MCLLKCTRQNEVVLFQSKCLEENKKQIHLGYNWQRVRRDNLKVRQHIKTLSFTEPNSWMCYWGELFLLFAFLKRDELLLMLKTQPNPLWMHQELSL